VWNATDIKHLSLLNNVTILLSKDHWTTTKNLTLKRR